MRARPLLAALAVAALAAAAAPAAAQLSPVCTTTRNAWLNSRNCNSWLSAFSNAIYSMTSWVEMQTVEFKGAYAKGPNYAPSVVQATWEGGYTSSGLGNKLQLFQPVAFNALVDGRVTCTPNLRPATYLSWRALGLSKPLMTPAVQKANLPALCAVTPLQQWPYAANATRLPQLWAYLSSPQSGGTADNSGLYLGCQNYTAAGDEMFDGVAAVSCSFMATFTGAGVSTRRASGEALLAGRPAADGGGLAGGDGASAAPAAAGAGGDVSAAGAVEAAMARGPAFTQ